MRGVRLAVVALGAALAMTLVTACGSAGVQDDVGTQSPAVVGSTTAPAMLSAPGALTAFGALRGDWDTVHVPAPQYAPASAYDLDPTLIPGQTPPQAKYGGVQTSQGRVLDYSVYLHAPLSAEAALAAAQAELPPDATVTWQRDAGRCLEFQFTSPTLAAIPEVAPRGGIFVAAFTSDSPPWMTLSVGDYADAADGPEC